MVPNQSGFPARHESKPCSLHWSRRAWCVPVGRHPHNPNRCRRSTVDASSHQGPASQRNRQQTIQKGGYMSAPTRTTSTNEGSSKTDKDAMLVQDSDAGRMQQQQQQQDPGLSSREQPANAIPDSTMNDNDTTAHIEIQSGKQQQEEALAYLCTYETMVRQQDAEHGAVLAHLGPCFVRLMQLMDHTDNNNNSTGDNDGPHQLQQPMPIHPQRHNNNNMDYWNTFLTQEISLPQLRVAVLRLDDTYYNTQQRQLSPHQFGNHHPTRTTPLSSSSSSRRCVECMTTDRQLMMVLQLLTALPQPPAEDHETNSTTAPTIKITWAEIVQCYKLCVAGMLTLQHLPPQGGGTDHTNDGALVAAAARIRARERTLTLIRLFVNNANKDTTGTTATATTTTTDAAVVFPFQSLVPPTFQTNPSRQADAWDAPLTQRTHRGGVGTETELTAVIRLVSKHGGWQPQELRRRRPFLVLFLAVAIVVAAGCYCRGGGIWRSPPKSLSNPRSRRPTSLTPILSSRTPWQQQQQTNVCQQKNTMDSSSSSSNRKPAHTVLPSQEQKKKSKNNSFNNARTFHARSTDQPETTGSGPGGMRPFLGIWSNFY